ncbi:hypothetical protein Q7P37_011196 [Cladosporium fusiforme]
MTLPPPKPNNLPSTFLHAGWRIKYNLLTSTSTPSTSQPQTLVFIHGTPWSSTVFQPLTDPLLKTNTPLRILLYDLPGYGQSQERTTTPSSSPSQTPTFQGNTSIATQALTLTALLTHLSIKSPSILAHDIAGTIALRAHLLHNLALSRLMLLDTNAVLPWGDGFYTLARSAPEIFARLPAHVYEAMLRAVVRSARSAGPAEGRDAWEEVLVAPWVGSGEAQSAFVRQIAQAEDGDVREMEEGGLYADVQVGVGGQGGIVVLWGEGDSWIPREKMERLVRLLGGEGKVRRFVVVEGAGAFGHVGSAGGGGEGG